MYIIIIIQCLSRTSSLSIVWFLALCPCVNVLVRNREDLSKYKMTTRESTEGNNFQEYN